MTTAGRMQAESALSPAPATPRVLVVEDESFLATLIEDILLAAGYRVIKAARVDAALEIVRDTELHAALLDINLNGVEVFPVAAELRKRGVPFVFASGYGREGLPADFADSLVVQKPYLPDGITAALASSLGRASA